MGARSLCCLLAGQLVLVHREGKQVISWFFGESEVAGEGGVFFKPHNSQSPSSRECSTATPVPRAQMPKP